MQDLIKTHAIEWKFHLPYSLQAAGVIEKKNGILKQKIKLLRRNHLGWLTKVLSRAFIPEFAYAFYLDYS